MDKSQPLGIKIKRIRKSLSLSREEFAKMLDISFSTLKNYELGYRSVSSSLIVAICNHPLLHKYSLWLVSDKTNNQIGQIEPPQLPEKEVE